MSESISIPLDSLIDLAVEHWRLVRWLESSGGRSSNAVIRRSIRILGDFLEQHHLGILELTGQPYEPGLAAEVVETLSDLNGPEKKVVIEETLSPIVRYNDQVVRHARIVIRHVGQLSDTEAKCESKS